MDVEDLWIIRTGMRMIKGGLEDILRLSVLPSGFVTVAKAAAEPPDTNVPAPV